MLVVVGRVFDRDSGGFSSAGDNHGAMPRGCGVLVTGGGAKLAHGPTRQLVTTFSLARQSVVAKSPSLEAPTGSEIMPILPVSRDLSFFRVTRLAKKIWARGTLTLKLM